MLKILIACGAGMSSSFLTQKLQNECKEKGLDDKYSFNFYPLEAARKDAPEIVKQYDVVMMCPHLRLFAKELVRDNNITTPLYILPPQMYGTMILEEVVADAEDIYNEYHKNPSNNPFRFPGEPDNALQIRRKVAFRHL